MNSRVFNNPQPSDRQERPHDKESPLAAGDLVLKLVAELEDSGIPYVCLRNHEELPHHVGNDVDLLVPTGRIAQASRILSAGAEAHGWRVIRAVQFSPLSIFLVSHDLAGVLHIDLFDRLEWHFLEYASASGILDGRLWSGVIFHPAPAEECYLNVVTRLIYHGNIRERHRLQFEALVGKGYEANLRHAFIRNLGPRVGGRLMDAAIAANWSSAERMARDIRRIAVLRHGIGSPCSLTSGMLRFMTRSLTRLIRPPGPFIVFEGADGVGKSSVIDRLNPFLKDLTGKSDTLLFHWKPTRTSVRLAGSPSGPAMNPRASARRSVGASICFLAYHWLGFWAGYLRFVLPARSRNRAVLGDRYAYEFFLDPARLRLNLPTWLSRVAAATVPQPDLVIGLVAAPEAIIARKPELGIDEIRQYQLLLKALALTNKRLVLVPSDEDLEHVSSNVRSSIVESLISNH